jgi:uncharacterized membrane protein
MREMTRDFRQQRKLRIGEKEDVMPGMGGMMSGMWIWTIVGVVVVLLLIVAIVKLLQKR